MSCTGGFRILDPIYSTSNLFSEAKKFQGFASPQFSSWQNCFWSCMDFLHIAPKNLFWGCNLGSVSASKRQICQSVVHAAVFSATVLLNHPCFSWDTGVLLLTVVFSVPTSWNQFFMLDVYNTDGTPLTVDQLCVQLERICNSSQQAAEEPVGILTSQHRDSWGKVYTKLISGELTRCLSANYASFPLMVSALVALLCV